MHNARIDSAEGPARPRSFDVSLRNREVVARNGDVKIVLERQKIRVVQSQVEFAVTDELVDSW